MKSDSPRHSADFAPLSLSPDELYTQSGLAGIDQRFLAHLSRTEPELHTRLLEVRASSQCPSRDQSAALMLALAPSLQTFLVELFGLQSEARFAQQGHAEFDAMYRVKWKFVRRQAVLTVAPEALVGFDARAARERLCAAMLEPAAQSSAPPQLTAPRAGFDEAVFARAVLAWQADPQQRELLELARLYSAWACTTPEGQSEHHDSVLFRLPQSHDPAALARGLPREPSPLSMTAVIRVHPRSRRLSTPESAFSLTDPGTDRAGALDQSRYCLLCHRNKTDSCSRGLDEQHAGCPLGERISEFHALRNEGLIIAALAMITADNPMVAATGHRICNDCVQACVFQSQTPVDIPQTESQTLQEVLALPWGLEIYGLLMQWNPLNLRHPLPRPDSGRKVLVAGAGPAGFTLAHHLLRDGHTVVLIDALRIEPLPATLRPPRQPLRDASLLEGPLQDRRPGGFGGVAEYGITVRWNKNRLDLIRLLLERRERFALLGSVRLGSTLGVQDALALGFDHIALAVGAGRPHLPDWPEALARGVRTASDFLMALQLEGAAREDHLSTLQIRLPAVVIGGGLTALDAATELQAWYVLQVVRFSRRHQALVAEIGPEAVEARWTEEDRETALIFLEHARAIEHEQMQAADAGRAPELQPLLRAWGGVTVVYRRELLASPAWRLNPSEVMHALEEGIQYLEQASPTHFEVDPLGAVQAVHLRIQEAHRRLPARTVLLALGTEPNTGLVDDEPDLRREGPWFALQGLASGEVHAPSAKSAESRSSLLPVLLADPEDCPPERRQRLSVFGDAHPEGAGSVVKAMASAQRGWPVVSEVLQSRSPQSPRTSNEFIADLSEALSARVHEVTLLAPGIVELRVRAPMAARRFQAGQFFRLQALEQEAVAVSLQGEPIRRAMEGLALTGAGADADTGLVCLVVLEMGGSSDLCRTLRPGQELSLMGPTGAPTEIVRSQTVVLAGGGLGNAVLLPIGKALRAAGCRVLYFAAYRQAIDVFHRQEIEAAADRVVWCCESDPLILPARPQDRAWRGNIVQAMQAWQEGAAFLEASGAPEPLERSGRAARDISFHAVDRLLVIGSDRMMAAVAKLRQGSLKDSLGRPQVSAWASVNSPMQCMMKGVCGQCLQWVVDPSSGRRRAVFTCAEQDQPLDWIDFEHLAQRLSQNHLLEQQMRSLLHCTKPEVER